MIASGEKKEEYREIKPYWINRLTWHEHHKEVTCISRLKDAIYANEGDASRVIKDTYFDVVSFKNGYSSNAPILNLKCEWITYGEGEKEWGAEPGKDYFVIILGEKIS